MNLTMKYGVASSIIDLEEHSSIILRPSAEDGMVFARNDDCSELIVCNPLCIEQCEVQCETKLCPLKCIFDLF